MSDDFNHELQRLSELDTKIIELGKEMLQGYQWPMDLLAATVMNRSLSLINGFVTLARDENFLAAAHLIRPNLDNYLRFYAAWLVDKPHEFAHSVMEGEQIRKMKDSRGAFMTDTYLLQQVKDESPWLQSVYEDTSGFIHLSRQHVISAVRLSEDGNFIQGTISRKDHFIPDAWKIEATQVMIAITKLICKMINSWTVTKNEKSENEKLKPE